MRLPENINLSLFRKYRKVTPLYHNRRKIQENKSLVLNPSLMHLLNIAPSGRTYLIFGTDYTDYTALYFTNAAAFVKWKHCLNNGTIVQTI